MDDRTKYPEVDAVFERQQTAIPERSVLAAVFQIEEIFLFKSRVAESEPASSKGNRSL